MLKNSNNTVEERENPVWIQVVTIYTVVPSSLRTTYDKWGKYMYKNPKQPKDLKIWTAASSGSFRYNCYFTCSEI